MEMAKATEMVQTLRGSVETILEVRQFSFLFFCFFCALGSAEKSGPGEM